MALLLLDEAVETAIRARFARQGRESPCALMQQTVAPVPLAS